MALISCPECGKENISDTAECCPSCGYGVRAHFEEIEREIELKEWRKEWEAKCQAMQKERMDKIKMPEEPKPSKGMMIYLATASLFLLYLLYFVISSGYYETIKEVLSVIGLIGLFVVFPAYCHIDNLKKAKSDYALACRDFEAYKKKKIEDDDRRSAMWSATWEKKYAKSISSSPIKCPNCGSIYTKRISTVNRAVSVGAVGLASSKIGKQYECTSCKYKW